MLDPSFLSDQSDSLRIFMAAGEVSGDRQAAFLARAMLAQHPQLILYGSGGEKMREAGVDIRIQTSHYGSVGFQESLRFVRPLRRVMSELRNLLRLDPPDMAVLVDNEGFNGLLAKFLHKEGIPFIYYFPPQVWLWGEWRAKGIAQRAHAIIPAFEAEAAIYRREGGNVAWFGHPLIDIVKTEPNRDAILASLGISPTQQIIALMPGSRFQEVNQLLERMLTAVRIIKQHHPDLHVIMPLAAPHLRAMVQGTLARTGMSGIVSIIENHIYTCLNKCDLIMLSSGTATLEAALLGVPMVVAYRVSSTTYLIGRQMVKSRFIAMPNILLDTMVVPELIQNHVTPERLAEEALSILGDSQRSQGIRSQLQSIRSLLGEPGVLAKAAGLILRETHSLHAMQHRRAM